MADPVPTALTEDRTRELASVRDLLRNLVGAVQNGLADLEALAKPPDDEPPKPPPKDEPTSVRDVATKILGVLQDGLRELDGALAEPGEDKPPPKPKDLNTNLDGALAKPPEDETPKPPANANLDEALTKPPEDEPPKPPPKDPNDVDGALAKPAEGETPPPKGGFTSVFTSVRGRRPFRARIPPSLPPLFPTSTTPSDNTETTMPIGTRNFAFAHARIESDGESVRVIRSTGFTSAITHPSDADPSSCAPPDELPKVAKVKPDDAGKLPPNTLLYRLLLPVNHQIDKKEAVVTATGATRETHEHYRMSAWAVNDRTVEVAVEIRNPDINAEAKEVFALDVIVFRID